MRITDVFLVSKGGSFVKPAEGMKADMAATNAMANIDCLFMIDVFPCIKLAASRVPGHKAGN